MTATTNSTPIDEARFEQFLDQVFGDLSACYGGVMVTLGDRLGLYRALAGAGPLTSEEVAARAGCAERYVREWLGSQVAAGYVEYDPDTSSYTLPPEHAAVLADPDSPALLTPAFNIPASMWIDEDQAVRAFQTGEGVPWGDHHERLFCGVAAFYRNAYRASLVPEWLPALDGVVDAARGRRAGRRRRLRPRPLDRADGRGVPALALRRHRPPPRVDRRGARARGGGRRGGPRELRGRHRDRLRRRGFDLICFFDCLHDLGDPVGAARHARSALAEGGTVMLIEPYAADDLEENTGPVRRAYYSASATVCTAHSLSEDVGAALGAQAGEARLAEVFEEAGFGHWRRAAETPFNLILEARA